MRSAEDTVKELIGNAGYGVPETDLFRGPVLPVKENMPANAIFVLENPSGREPRRIHDEARSLMLIVNVQVRVRDRRYGGGYDRAKEIWAMLAAIGAPAAWSQIKMLQSGPLYIGRTDDELHNWSINVELMG